MSNPLALAEQGLPDVLLGAIRSGCRSSLPSDLAGLREERKVPSARECSRHYGSAVDENLLNGPACAFGLATYSVETLLDVWYPDPTLGSTPIDIPGLDAGAVHDELRGVTVRGIRTEISRLDQSIAGQREKWTESFQARFIIQEKNSVDGAIPGLTTTQQKELDK